MLFCNKWYHNKLNEQIWQVSWIIPISECNAWYLELPWKQRKTCNPNKDFLNNFTLPFWIYVTYQKIMQLFKLANFWLHVAMEAPNMIKMRRKPWTLSIVLSQRVCYYYNTVKCYFTTFKNCPIMWENRHMQTCAKLPFPHFSVCRCMRGRYLLNIFSYGYLLIDIQSIKPMR